MQFAIIGHERATRATALHLASRHAATALSITDAVRDVLYTLDPYLAGSHRSRVVTGTWTDLAACRGFSSELLRLAGTIMERVPEMLGHLPLPSEMALNYARMLDTWVSRADIGQPSVRRLVDSLGWEGIEVDWTHRGEITRLLATIRNEVIPAAFGPDVWTRDLLSRAATVRAIDGPRPIVATGIETTSEIRSLRRQGFTVVGMSERGDGINAAAAGRGLVDIVIPATEDPAELARALDAAVAATARPTPIIQETKDFPCCTGAAPTSLSAAAA